MPNPSSPSLLLPSIPALCLEHHLLTRAQFPHPCEADNIARPLLDAWQQMIRGC